MFIDDHNLHLLKSIEDVDEVNSKFYGRFQYPQPPIAFDAPSDPSFETIMLNQSIGSWDHSIIPDRPNIWVAGCGTNQAVYTGLRYPKANVVASDLSPTSIATSRSTAKKLGVKNIEFRQESINQVTYHEEFDYLICTGVIHHNADPSASLIRLASALKPAGILELMVYNRYHRRETTAFQKAIRLLADGADFESELRIARKIAEGVKLDNFMVRFLTSLGEISESHLADRLLQPIEYSFTIESLESLLADCGLELVAPCINQFDKDNNTFNWNLEFDDPEVAAIYHSKSDSHRWKISNHLMMEKSPMLWFYCQRQDSGRRRVSEEKLCERFLELRFTQSKAKRIMYYKLDDGSYERSARLPAYPGSHPDPVCRKIVEEIASQPEQSIKDVLRKIGLDINFSITNKLRLCLTTNAYPYLQSRRG
jgi:2-polyprenyl-3-methyl-5-hydroxy-6-metoxy-1,4-benzoquinol methylase